MILSRDYTHIRLAALPDNVIEKLLQQYPFLMEGDELKSPLKFQDVKEIEKTFAKHLPGKEDLVTQWFLMGMQQNRAYFPGSLLSYVDMAQWFFTHQKEPLFRELAQKRSEWVHRELNPKNILHFNSYDMQMIREKYREAEAAARLNKFPEALPEGAKVYYDDGNHQVIEITEVSAACELGQGTEWCTRKEGHAGHYLDRGPLYAIYRNRDKIAQLFIGDGYTPEDIELKNLKNKSWKPDPEVRQVLVQSGLMESILNTLAQGGIDYKSIIMGFIGTEDNPGIRELCSHDPHLAYTYAVGPLKRHRFPEGEEAIATDIDMSMDYSAHVLRGRFPAAEESLTDFWRADEYVDMLRRINPQDYQELLKEHPHLSGRGFPDFEEGTSS